MENEPILHTINVVLTDCSCSYFFYVCNEIIHVLGSPVWIWPSFIFKKKRKKEKAVPRLLILWRRLWAAVTSRDPQASLKGPHWSLQSLWQVKYGGLISLPTSGTRTERNTLVLTLEFDIQIRSEGDKRLNPQWAPQAGADAPSTKPQTGFKPSRKFESHRLEQKTLPCSSLILQNKTWRNYL